MRIWRYESEHIGESFGSTSALAGATATPVRAQQLSSGPDADSRPNSNTELFESRTVSIGSPMHNQRVPRVLGAEGSQRAKARSTYQELNRTTTERSIA